MKAAALHPGAPLFIFDENTLLMLGIFQTTTAASENIDPTAFRGQLPIQVQFSIALDSPPLHIAEPDFHAVFPTGPAFGPIGLRETKMLANVFALRAGVLAPPTALMTGSDIPYHTLTHTLTHSLIIRSHPLIHSLH